MSNVILPDNFKKQNCDFVNDLPIIKNKQGDMIIPFDYFRDLFINDREIFFKIISELSLRGTHFKLNEPSNLFPQYNEICQDSEVIINCSNNKATTFKDINFSFFSIQHVMSNLDIENNSFFEGIPLKGFLSIGVSAEKLPLLKKEFERNKFNFISLREYKIKYFHVEVSKTSTTIKEPDIPPFMKDTYNEIVAIISLDRIIFDNRLRKLFKDGNLVNVGDLYTHEGFNIISTMTTGDIKNLKRYLNRIYTHDELLTEAINYYFINLQLIPDVSIGEVLNSSQFKIIKEKALELKIKKLSDLIDFKKTVCFLNIRSFGVKKKQEVLKNIVLALETNKSTVNTVIYKDEKREYELKNTEIKDIINGIFDNVTQHILLSDLIEFEDLNQLFLSKNIISFKDLNSDSGHTIINSLNISMLNKLKKKLKEISYIDVYKSDHYLAKAINRYLTLMGPLPHIEINEILNSSRYNSVVARARKRGLHNLSNLSNYKKILEFLKIKSFGVAKKKYFVKRVSEMISEYNTEHSNFDEILKSNIFIYPEIKKLNKTYYAHENKLYFSSIKDGAEVLSKLNGMGYETNRKHLVTMYKKLPNINSFRKKLDPNFDVSLEIALEYFGFKSVFNQNTISELTPFRISEIIDQLPQIEIKNELELVVKYIAMEIQKFYEKLNSLKEFLDSDDRNVSIYKQRLVGKTLSEVGGQFAISRERARQIERIMQRKIIGIFPVKILNLLELTFYENGMHQVNNLIDEIFIKLINSDTSSKLYYSEKFNVIINIDNKKTLNQINGILENISNDIYVGKDVVIERIKNLKTETNKNLLTSIINNLEKYIVKYNIKEIEGYLITKKLNYTNLFELLITEKMNGRVDLNDPNNLFQLKNYFARLKGKEEAKKYFSGETNKIIRKISSILSHNESFVSLGSNSYRLIDHQRIPHQLLNQIGKYIEQELIEEEFVTPIKIMNQFKQELIELNYTFDVIYNFLKRLFDDMFEFGKGNTMYIFPKGAPKKTTEQLIYNKLVELGGKADKKCLAEKLGLNVTSIEQNVLKSPKMRTFNSKISTVDNINSIYNDKEFVDSLLKIGNEQLSSKHFISSFYVFQKLRFDRRFSSILHDYGIIEDVLLMPVIKELFPNLEGHTKFIHDPNLKLQTYEVILSELDSPERFSRKDFNEAGDKLNYGNSTKSLILDDAINDLNIIRLNSTYFMDARKLLIDELIINKVNEYLLSSFNEYNYISIQSLKGYRRKLPPIENSISWSPEIIYYIALKYLNYRSIEITGIHYYDNPLILTSKYTNLEYNGIALVKLKEYQGNMHEENIYNYFVKEGLLNGASNNKRLPKQLFDDGVIEKNEYGIIKIFNNRKGDN